jgi:hypothetical protein
MSEQIQKTPAQSQVEAITVKIAKLKPHPLEAAFFSAPPSNACKALAEKMGRIGQADLGPFVEVLPDFTIISDHERVLAAKHLGWTKVDAVVRTDHAEQDEVLVEEFVRLARMERRGRHKLEKARDLKRLHEIGQREWREGRRRHDDLHPDQQRDLYNLLAEVLDQKGRSLNRWMAILEAPVAVQDAYIRGEINLVTAEAAGRPETKAKIAKAIQAGASVKEVLAEYQPNKDGRHKHTGAAFASLLRSLKRGTNDLDGREEEVVYLDRKEIEELDEGIALLQRLRSQVQEREPNQLDQFMEVLQRMGPLTGRRKRRKVAARDSIQLT